MKQSLESFGTEIKGWIPTSAVTMLYFFFFNASINLEHQVPHWDTLLHPSISVFQTSFTGTDNMLWGFWI